MAKGRMLQNRISNSRRMALLKNDTARLLYTWMLAHLDLNGCFYADPKMVNSIVFTRLDHLFEMVKECLEDLAQHDLIMRYEVRDEWYLWYPDFLEKQNKIDSKKEARPVIPPPPDELKSVFLAHLNDKYGVTPEQLQSNSGVSLEELRSNSGVSLEELQSNSTTSQVKLSQKKLNQKKSIGDFSFENCIKPLTDKITLKIAKDEKDMAVSKMCGLFENRGWCVSQDMCSNIIMCVVNKVGLKSDVKYLGPYFGKAVYNWINEHAEQINQTVKNIRSVEDNEKTCNITQLALFKDKEQAV